MRKPMLESGESMITRDGHTEPLLPIADDLDEVDQDDVETLREIKAALAFVEADRNSDHDISVCTAPESVGSRRSEFPAADPPSTGDVSK